MAKGGGHNKGQKMPYRVVRTFAGEPVRRSAHWTIGSAQADMMMSLYAANAGRVEFSDGELEIVDVRTDEVIDKPLKCVVCDEMWATETGHARKDAPSTCRDCGGMDEPGGSDQDVLAPDLPYTPPSVTDTMAIGVTAGGEVVEREFPPITSELAMYRRRPLVVDGSRLDEMIVGEPRSGKTSAAAVAELARTIVADRSSVSPALEAAVAPFLRVNPLPDADPSALLEALERLNIERAVWADGTVAAVAHGMLFTMQAEPHAVHGGSCGVWSVATPVGVRGQFVAAGAARFIRDRRTP